MSYNDGSRDVYEFDAHDVDIEQSFDKLAIKSSKRRKATGTGLVYNESMTNTECLWDKGHIENPNRFTSILNRFRELDLENRCQLIEPRHATKEEVLTVHTEQHYELIKSTEGQTDESGLEKLSSKFDAVYFHPNTFQAALQSAGSTINLVDAIVHDKVRNGFALVRPPGHHAMSAEACGFCFFNNVAIGAQHALNTLGLERILIVDWDVHHGQATQYTFDDDPRVFYMSIHRYEHGAFWPELIEGNSNWVGKGPGIGFNCNIPLNETEMNDRDYLAIFHNIILPLAYQFNPQLVLVSAGYDAAIGCPEGQMLVSPATYGHMTHHLLALAEGRVGIILEGGYCPPSLAEGAALTLKSLLGDPCPKIVAIDGLKIHDSLIESILDVTWSLRPHWLDSFPLQGCFDRRDGGVNEETRQLCEQIVRTRHYPVVEYRGVLGYQENKPETYPTRGCNPVQPPEVKAAFAERISKLISLTDISNPFHGRNRTCLVYDEAMSVHKSSDQSQPERASRIQSIWKKLTDYGLVDQCDVLHSRPAADDELLLAHSKDHVVKMNFLCDFTQQELDKLSEKHDSVYFNRKTTVAAKLAAGSLLQMVDSVLSGQHLNGFAVIRPPGHHASACEPAGFCYFNNVAIAAKYAVKKFGIKKVLIVDWDVHHGDGTQKLVSGDNSILFVSIHRYDRSSFYPNSIIAGSRTGFKNIINIPFNDDKMADAEYMSAFFNIVLPVATDFQPELVLVSSGFDAAINDPLGSYKVSPEAYGHMTHHLCALANGRVVAALEGGYNLETIAKCSTEVVNVLLGHPPKPLELKQLSASAADTLKEVTDYHRSHWPSLKFGVDLPPKLFD
ncbi:Histone deacetylase 6 [Halotydeus destructor]|nr:Histone deacetylase 6 [Halotydeus destructor]